MVNRSIFICLSLLTFSINGRSQSWKTGLWIPPQYAGVDTETYQKYCSLLRQSSKCINECYGDVPTFCYHNRFVAYVHLQVQSDTLSKYSHESINFNPVCQCNRLHDIIEKWKFDTILPSSFKYEWKCALDRCSQIFSKYDKPLMQVLLQIKKDDQEIREDMERFGNAQFEDSPWILRQWAKQNIKDSLNLIKIDTIIARWGYPGRSLVGDELSNVAFYVIQHAPAKRQDQYLPLVKDAAMRREISFDLYGYLVDRIRMFRNEKQLFGTQTIYNSKTKKMELYPIEDISNIDERRRKMGMGTLNKYLKNFGIDGIKQ